LRQLVLQRPSRQRLSPLRPAPLRPAPLRPAPLRPAPLRLYLQRLSLLRLSPRRLSPRRLSLLRPVLLRPLRGPALRRVTLRWRTTLLWGWGLAAGLAQLRPLALGFIGILRWLVGTGWAALSLWTALALLSLLLRTARTLRSLLRGFATLPWLALAFPASLATLLALLPLLVAAPAVVLFQAAEADLPHHIHEFGFNLLGFATHHVYVLQLLHFFAAVVHLLDLFYPLQG